ncbi:ABC transporter ATP-binding protein [Streptomyces albipurpureus]|uniref:ABC transporter ATP-binding protein/permease n=1 Tax=Streptomyces albipurpureus TaxID=2897419 RepID=A0ABT0UVY8_9ACTN|nr:ABC transporter ATP-binding protein [Streptomyces sp. CWNU-1]MCM2392764.1 ABC transporter ATP-binding protein/permease [Streptomyces sp. CWNU-1]
MTGSRPAVTSPPSATSVRFLGAGRIPLAAVAICSAGAALAAVALPAAIGTTVDQLVTQGRIPWPALLLCAALTALEVLLDAVVALLGGTTTAMLTARLRTAVLDRVIRAEPRHGQVVSPGDLTTRLTANAADAAAVPVTAATAVAGVLLPLGGIVGLFLIDPWTGLALLVGAPAFVLLLRTLVRRTADAAADYQREQALVATRLTETLDGIATVRAAHSATRERARITEPLTALAAHGRRTWQIHGSAAGTSAVLLPLLSVLVLAVAGVRLAAGAISVGDLLAVSRYAVLAVGLGSLTGALGAIARGRSAARRLDPLLTLPSIPHRSRTLPPDGPGTLELRDIDVTREGEQPLRKVNLTVPGGTSLAVVGRSGSGKSLLAAVAGRLTDPDGGTVLLDGVPLDGVDPVVLRHEVGYAFARPALLGRTVEDTIAAGAVRPTGAEVRAAARAASADGFITLLPQGYRTPLDQAPLSGGERQRLGLARAFAHAGRLLILDDATSSLDTITERQVQRALAQRAGMSTRIVVAHRVSSAVEVDRVVWLENGEVRAVGRHSDLWADPDYRQVFHAAGTTAHSGTSNAVPNESTHSDGDGDGDTAQGRGTELRRAPLPGATEPTPIPANSGPGTVVAGRDNGEGRPLHHQERQPGPETP